MANPAWVDDLIGSSAGTYRPGPRVTGTGAAAAHLPQIRAAAGRYGLDPTLLAGVVDFESSGNPGAINRSSGATGLGQVMPRERGFPDRPTQAELLNPDTNLDWSARILKSGLDRYGSEDKALAAYLGAIDARGNITGAVDANGTGGNQYIRTVRERQRQYRGAEAPSSGTPPDTSGAPPWVQDLLSAAPGGAAPAPTTRAPAASAPAASAPAASAPPVGADAPEWVRDMFGASGTGQRQTGGSSYTGAPQTDEIWPVAGQQWGRVNNPFGGTQSRSAGATVALPAYNVGADLTARYGDAVVAPVSGTIEQVYDARADHNPNENSGWGGMTVLRGDNGYFYRFSHAAPGSIATRPGQRVEQGQLLERVGVSGNSTGPHLDAEKFSAPGKFVDITAGRGGTVSAGAGSSAASSGGVPGGAPAWVQDLLGRSG